MHMILSSVVTDIVTISIIVLILSGAIFYVVKSKKNGAKCIGCPYSKTCSKNKSIECSCLNEDVIRPIDEENE